MMFVTADAYSYFMSEWGGDYPYCELKKTRSQFYAKYAVICSKSKSNVPRRGTSFDVVTTSSFDKETLRHLFLSKQAIPLTPTMAEIMDWMYCWGRNKSDSWYERTLEWFMFLCTEKISVSKRELIFDTIAIKVREDIHCYFVTTQMTGWLTYNEWVDWFNFQYENITEDFFELSYKSIGYVQSRCEALVEATTAPTNATPEVPVSFAATNIVSP